MLVFLYFYECLLCVCLICCSHCCCCHCYWCCCYFSASFLVYLLLFLSHFCLPFHPITIPLYHIIIIFFFSSNSNLFLPYLLLFSLSLLSLLTVFPFSLSLLSLLAVFPFSLSLLYFCLSSLPLFPFFTSLSSLPFFNTVCFPLLSLILRYCSVSPSSAFPFFTALCLSFLLHPLFALGFHSRARRRGDTQIGRNQPLATRSVTVG